MSRFGSISPMEAFSDLGETKLSTRIGEMKRRGIETEGREEVVKNRFGQEVRYMRYRLRESGTPGASSPTKHHRRYGAGSGREPRSAIGRKCGGRKRPAVSPQKKRGDEPLSFYYGVISQDLCTGT